MTHIVYEQWSGADTSEDNARVQYNAALGANISLNEARELLATSLGLSTAPRRKVRSGKFGPDAEGVVIGLA